MHSVAAHTRSRLSVAGRIQCKNVAVCRMSAYADLYGVYAEGAEADGETPGRGVLIGLMEPTRLCTRCHYAVGYELDIVEAGGEECAVCFRPMLLGVKWNADACKHRFCPACTHQMLFGMPRPTYESYQSRVGDHVELHDDGRMVASVDTLALGDVGARTSCPMCRATRKQPQWMEPTSRTVTCIWLYGNTGTGKTRAARDDLTSKFGERGFFVYDNPREFVGYNLECGMLLDDYDPADIPMDELLSIISGDARYVDPGRGAERLPLLAEFVYVTSLLPPERYFAEGSPVLALLTAVTQM
jgi:Zn ribbon nucleic-acid-binding protein